MIILLQMHYIAIPSLFLESLKTREVFSVSLVGGGTTTNATTATQFDRAHYIFNHSTLYM